MAVATTAARPPLGATARPVRRRALVIAAGVAAGALIWALAVPVFGVQLLVRFGAGTQQTVSVAFVLAGSLIAPLLGWALLSFLERRTNRARALWTRVAVVSLLMTFALPLAAGVTTSARVTLLLMHVAVGTVVIVGLRRT
ncbi:MAG: hypothetical protein JOZ46_07135 [Candidatus Dormibacteraeota bacterium]|nr:hypothetical protein [Candidatus Dormibacteraeota bacterium]MBV9525571.1 hypothetical protein [Candidatus Dormibacteraeota bacterium]